MGDGRDQRPAEPPPGAAAVWTTIASAAPTRAPAVATSNANWPAWASPALATALIKVLARRGIRLAAALKSEGYEPLEVYPFATLKLLGLPWRAKRTPAGRRRIRRALKPLVPGFDRQHASEHQLDAVVCADRIPVASETYACRRPARRGRDDDPGPGSLRTNGVAPESAIHGVKKVATTEMTLASAWYLG